MTEHELTALDGTNPLGYMAALGVLRVLDEAGHLARLRWELRDAWRPILSVDMTLDQLVDALVTDAKDWGQCPALDLEYQNKTAKGTKLVRELKPPPALFQQFLATAVQTTVTRPRDSMPAAPRRLADHLAAFGAAHEHLGTDLSGEATKPTAFHFCAGQQLFLAAVRTIREALRPQEIEEAIAGPWTYESKLPVLGWDVAAGARDYALRAKNPSTDKKRGVPGADWLGFRSLAFFPVVLRDGHAHTTGFEGSGKSYRFTWALWEPSLGASEARTVVGMGWAGASQDERDARGVRVVLRSPVRRTDQGGYGSFGPASTL